MVLVQLGHFLFVLQLHVLWHVFWNHFLLVLQLHILWQFLRNRLTPQFPKRSCISQQLRCADTQMHGLVLRLWFVVGILLVRQRHRVQPLFRGCRY